MGLISKIWGDCDRDEGDIETLLEIEISLGTLYLILRYSQTGFNRTVAINPLTFRILLEESISGKYATIESIAFF